MQIRHGRRKNSLRLRGYDYSQPGGYFITVCTDGREHLFGEIHDVKMIENQYGQIVGACWNDLPNHYPNVELDEFVVMPNHMHGIILIMDNDVVVGARSPRPVEEESWRGATARRPYEKPTLGKMVAYFKYQSAKKINELRHTPGLSVWQRGFYDHIYPVRYSYEKKSLCVRSSIPTR